MEKIKYDRNILKKFGITMGVVLALISLLLLRKHNITLAIVFLISAILFFVSAFTFVLALKYIYIWWMRLAFLLSWVNTRLLLTVIFYLLFTPISLILKVFRVDLLGLKSGNKESYWIKAQKKHFEGKDYENQF